MDPITTIAFLALVAIGALAGCKVANAHCDWDDAALLVLCAAVAFAMAIAGGEVAIR